MVSRSSFMSSHELPHQTLSWWKHLEDVLKRFFVFIFRKRLQDVFIKTNIFALLIRLQKMSSRRYQDEYIRLTHTSSEDVLIKTKHIRLGHTSSRRLQDVFKTSSRRFQDVLPRHLQNVFKMSCKKVFKTSSRSFQEVLNASSRRYQGEYIHLTHASSEDVLIKTKHIRLGHTSSKQKKFSRSFQDVFKTSSRSLQNIYKTSC